MELLTKYQKDLEDKIDYLEEQILKGSSFEDTEGIALEYQEKLGELRGYKDALEIFKHNLKVFVR